MKKRLINLPEGQTYFLFGARGTGKSTLLKQHYKSCPHLYIDLLNVLQERYYLSNPQRLKAEVLALPTATKLIIIDEVQKIPELLDVVHSLIEETDKKFILTGSSARKLKRGHANLLAGRAFLRKLYPFSFIELGKSFSLDHALQFGLLPKLINLKTDSEKADFLRAYSHLYLKEEIWAEHLIRNLEPFRYFLEVAAQSNGAVINVANISRDVGVDDKSISQYFSILEDTLIGFHLPAFNRSIRKSLTQKPKFYFIDTGIARGLARELSVPLLPSTYEYGKLFEHFVVLECYKLINYFYPDYGLFHLRSHDGLEIDLVIERPGQPLLLIEIKSTDEVRPDHLKFLKKARELFGNQAECVCLARVPRALKFDDIMVYPWVKGIMQLLYPKK